ncbi:MAG: hypothetical protein HN551_03880 [Tateyamaria sp.]|jgi:hypothetical protein|nr:hypothetical protein [Tateyamaria sp.]MCH9748933.1 hypothetical protein [Alphaproteobacteria bacterium]MBT5301733.1 hypothetical protein [Tateyamaria sp.]MBT6342237.1 hypothetical protein [Tateyamaria sp.]MBT7448207.1 hypothetical protein [Tateyamaria sp.]
MKIKALFLCCFLLVAPKTGAESLLGKITSGANAIVNETTTAVTGVTKSVGDSISSTEELLSNEDTPDLTRQRIDIKTSEILARLFAEEPGALDLFEKSAGYAVFDARRIGLIGVTGGFGRGVAVSKTTGKRTYMEMGTGGANIGLGIGGFERKIVVLFEDAYKFEMFSTGGYDATANAGAMFGEDKTEETVRFVNGRTIFVLTNKGWKVSASATGTKYWVDKKLN